MRKIIVILIFVMTSFCGSSFADSEQMNQTLAKIADQLEAIKPLIIQAQQEQSQNPITKVHFNSWVDANGYTHKGLLQDISSIQNGVINAINKTSVNPRKINQISDDFVTQNGN